MRQAKARIAKIDALLADENTENRASLQAERSGLVDSWVFHEEVEIDGIVTEAEGKALAEEAAKEAERQAIRDELAANDAKALRTLFAGETDRIAAYIARQDALRKKLAET
jgi:hypothetical protein